MAQLKFSTCLVKLIASFLTNGKFKVSIEGELSSFRGIATGVPQGSVLAPVLYSLHMMPPQHLELILLSSYIILARVYTRQGKTNDEFLINYNAA
jgi:hypothetical protein